MDQRLIFEEVLEQKLSISTKSRDICSRTASADGCCAVVTEYVQTPFKKGID
jgi:hypothetical protein